MSFAMIKQKAHALFDEARFIAHIQNDEDYEKALAFMDELVDDYDHNLALIEILHMSIERWEDTAQKFDAFNLRIQSLDSGKAVLAVLMDQYHLGVNDFPEIGSKSLMSKILNGKRRLTLDHIRALSKRFNIDASLFFV